MSRGSYWIYHLDVDDNFLDAESIEAVDDLGALLHAHNLQAQIRADGYIIELWDHDRMIARLEPGTPKRKNARAS
jgi:hypothetical protein